MINTKKAIELKKELDALRPLSKEDEMRIMQKFRLDWNYHSNNLESNSLTFGETKALIMHGITAQGKPLKDHFEITGHNEAIHWVLDVVKQDMPMTENFIRELHTLILKESYEVAAEIPDGKPTKRKIQVGSYKSAPNHVKTVTGEIFRFATPEETPSKMHDLMQWYREASEKEDVNPILLAAEFHYKFIRIHPFDDGNGRTVRILMNFILMQHGFPPAVIKTGDKQNYFAALQQADTGMLESFVEYIAGCLVHALDLMIKGAKGESIEEPDDLEKEMALLEKRLETVAKPAEVLKSQEAVGAVYDNVFVNIVNQFKVRSSSLFDKLYVTTDGSFQYEGGVSPLHHEAIINVGKSNFGNTKGISCQFNYSSFKQIGFGEFSYKSSFNFLFHMTTYKVYNSANLKFEKPYNELLSEAEIKELIDSELKAHMSFLEQKIEAFEKEKKD